MHGGPKTVEKAKKHEQAFEAPVFEKGYPSYSAVNGLKEAVEYNTYSEYCASRVKAGLQVIPESFYNSLKEEQK